VTVFNPIGNNFYTLVFAVYFFFGCTSSKEKGTLSWIVKNEEVR
jgi:hypothetical protein